MGSLIKEGGITSSATVLNALDPPIPNSGRGLRIEDDPMHELVQVLAVGCLRVPEECYQKARWAQSHFNPPRMKLGKSSYYTIDCM